MRKIDNFENVEEVKGNNPVLKAGPKVCEVKKLTDVEDREYLKIEFDIVEEGDFKGVFQRISDSIGAWPNQGTLYRSYKQTALPYFKRFIVAVEKSNSDYKFNFDEQTLLGKKFVGNFGIEEYDNGTEIKEGLKVKEVRSIQSLKEGKVITPKPERLPAEDHKKYEANTQGLPDLGDAETPF